MENKMQRMKELIPILVQAAKAYYQEDREIMSNFEYDRLYDELASLERETGVILSGSPTQQVGYQVLEELPKETHESPMLSLDKTKSVDDLAEWLGDQKGLLSWKMDGLTIVLTYRGGELSKAVTRGKSLCALLTRGSLPCGARRLSGIRILRASMKRLRMWMRNTKIPGTCAAALCAS